MTASGTSSRGFDPPPDLKPPSTGRGLTYGLVFLLIAAIGAGTMLVLTPMGVPKHTPTMASDGKPAWLIECSHSGDCIRESALTCPRGYDTVAQGAQSEHTVVNTGKVMVPVDTFSGAMVIRCVAER